MDDPPHPCPLPPGERDIIGSSPLRGEGWERVQNEYYFDTVNNTFNTGQKKLIE